MPDRAAAGTLGAALRRAGYSEDLLYELLGEDAYSGGPEDRPVHERLLPQTPLASVVRAFFLELPVPTSEIERALGKRALLAIEQTALAEVGDEVVPLARITPIENLLIASDGFSRGADDPQDYVATYNPTTRLCDSLTPRRRAERALDVGTGGGAHALLAARHMKHVVATDLNERALAYTELNAALNGVDNVECRRGSLFDPVEGEMFDLITCNAPFVVSPERRWAYRDGGFEADEVSERVVRGAAERLAEGGFATLLVSWVAHDEDDPDARALSWVEGSGCDGWILATTASTPLEHAAAWNSHLDGDLEAFGTTLDDWTSYLEALGVKLVNEGAIILHRGGGRRHRVRSDEIDSDEVEAAGEQIERAFAGRARLDELRRQADLLDVRLAPAEELALEHELAPAPDGPDVVEARVWLAEGTHPVVDASPRAAEAIGTLDGGATLRDVIELTAERLDLSPGQARALTRETLELARELLELGMLELES